MSLARILLFGQALVLSAALTTAALPLAAPAHAQSGDSVLDDDGVMALLPAGLIEGDGQTAVSLNVVALEADGSPMAPTRLKLTASSGTVTEPVVTGSGLITFDFTPPQVSGATDVRFNLRGKHASGEALTAEWSVAVSPALPSGMTVNSNPVEIALGQDQSATLSIQLSGGANQPQVGADLEIRAVSGSVANVTHLGSGQFSCLYTPPNVNYPHLDVLTIVDKRSPGSLFGAYVIKLVGNTNFPVQSAANATVLLKIGEREFGPFTTDTTGRADMPITVPPGVSEATLTSIAGGQTSTTVMDLKVPATRRLNLFPVPAGLPADGLQPVPVRVAVYTPTGEPDANARVNFTATAGSISEARHEGDGVYVADFTAPVMQAASSATIQVSIAGEPGVQADSMDIQLVPTRPLSLTLTPEPTSLDEGATGFKVYAKVIGPDGEGIGGRDLSFGVNGARMRGAPNDLKSGDYEILFATTGENHVELTGTVSAAATGNPARAVLVLPSQNRVSPDGLSSVLLTVVAVDEFGYPVAGVPVNLSVAAGDGSVPGQVTTDESGYAQVYYTAGQASGVVTLQASSGDMIGGASLLQFPPEVAAGMQLPSSGSEWSRGLQDSWRGIVTSTTVQRAGATGVAAVATRTAERPAAVGPIETLAVTVSPAEVAAGGSVTITVNAIDGNGNGVSGQAPELVVVPGTVSTVQDNGDGSYTAQLTAPAGTTGKITLVTSTADGQISEVSKIPISAASAWGTVAGAPSWGAETQPAEATPAETQPAETTPDEPAVAQADSATSNTTTAPPPPPKEPGEYEWFRARFGPTFGAYNYTQTTNAPEDGPLWSQNISLDAAAGLVGGGLDVAAWLPSFDYVGGELEAGVGYYATEWPNEAGTVVADWVPHIAANAMGRYPFVAGNARFHVGVKVGAQYGDFITYRKGETDTQLQYEPLALWGLGLGAELGADIGDRVFLKVGAVEGLRGADLYSTRIEGELGVGIVGNLYGAAAYTFTNRSIDVLASPSLSTIGTLADTSSLFSLGIGYQM